MTDTQLLEQCIKNSGLKKKAIAEAVGISPWGLTKKIRNDSEFMASEIVKLCDILKIDQCLRERIFFDAV